MGGFRTFRCPAAALCLLMVVLPALSAETENRVRNGNFSQIEDGLPVGWKMSGDANVEQMLDIHLDGKNPCARLRCVRIARKSPASHAMIAQSGHVKIEKSKRYQISFRARAEDLRGRTISVAISDTKSWENCGLHKGFSLSKRWKVYTTSFLASRSAHANTRLQFWYQEPGTLYLDDVRIRAVDPGDVVYTRTVRPASGRNLTPDGSFEAGGLGWSTRGLRTGWGSLQRLHGSVIKGDAAHGERFLRVPLGDGRTAVSHFDYLRPAVRQELQPLAAHRRWIAVKKGERYTISCSMRASADGVRAAIGIRETDPGAPRWRGRDQRKQVTLTTEWKRYSHTLRAQRRYVYMTVGPDLERDERVHVDIDAVQFERGDGPSAFVPRMSLEVELAPSSQGGIFTRGEPASIQIQARNHGDRPAQATIHFAVRDYFGRRSELPSQSLRIEAGGTMRRAVPLPASWRGYHRVVATWKAGKLEESRALRIAIVPRRKQDDSVLGINHAFSTPDLIRLARRAGITWYRDWSLKWQDLEPEPGKYRWAAGDAQVDRVIREKVSLMALLPPFPSARWSSEAPAGIPDKGYPGDRLKEAWGPQDPAKLAEFVEKVSRRYKGRVDVWQFLNEPIYTNYSLPGKKFADRYPKPFYEYSDYVRLLGLAAAAMRRGNADCHVIGGLGAGPLGETVDLIEAGCLKHVDLFDIHVYPGSRPPEAYLSEMTSMLDVMDKNGGRKPIWVTEFSYYGADHLSRRPFLPGGGWSEQRLLESERQCADYTVRFLTVMLARGVERVFLHSGASGPVNEAEFECCLFAYGGAPRKTLPAVAVFTNMVGHAPKLAGERRFGADGHAIAFDTPDGSVIVLWNADEDGSAALKVVPTGAKCTDIMGTPLPGRNIPLGPSPVYITAPKGAEVLRKLQIQAHER